MVGDRIRTGGGPAALNTAALNHSQLAAELRADYDGAAGDWAGGLTGPGPMYEPLARSLVAADLSEGMLRRVRGGTPVVADAVALPFRDGRFDLVLAAFCLNHLGRVDDGLAEARRVGAAIAASAFAPGWTHPAKDAADGAFRSFGYQPPSWYAVLAPGSRAGDPEVLAESAAAAGFTRVQARTVSVPTGLVTPAELVAWRLGMAHYAPFLRSLDPAGRAAARRAAERAVAVSISGATGAGPLVVEMVVLTAS